MRLVVIADDANRGLLDDMVPLPEGWQGNLVRERDRAAVRTALAEAEVVVARRFPSWMAQAAPHIRLLQVYGGGSDDVALSALAPSVEVAGTSGYEASVAQHAVSLVLALEQNLVAADRASRRGCRLPGEAGLPPAVELAGRTVGIVGLGNVGARVAELCRGLFRMRVLAYDPYLTEAEIAARGAEKVTLDTLLRESHFVSINCPRNKETLGMISAAHYALMRPDAYFITTARGGIHDEAALAEALADRRIAGAGLDVWAKEPPEPDHPLLRFDNVLVSPHTAGVTHESRREMGRYAAEQMLAVLDGKRPPRLINPEVWGAYRDRFARIRGFAPAA